MLGVQHVPLVAVQRTMDVAVGEELFLQPHGPRHAEGGEAFGGDPEIGLEDPLELEERLVVKADVREPGRRDSRSPAARGSDRRAAAPRTRSAPTRSRARVPAGTSTQADGLDADSSDPKRRAAGRGPCGWRPRDGSDGRTRSWEPPKTCRAG